MKNPLPLGTRHLPLLSFFSLTFSPEEYFYNNNLSVAIFSQHFNSISCQFQYHLLFNSFIILLKFILLDIEEWQEVTKVEIPENFNVADFEKELEESVLNLDEGEGGGENENVDDIVEDNEVDEFEIKRITEFDI
jgi:hypothetical protein